MATDKRFGALLGEGVSSVARRQRKRMGQVKDEIAEALGFSAHSVQRWLRGFVPTEPAQVAFLARYCVTDGRMERDWAESLLIHARHPDCEVLLRELFPDRPRRAAIPR